MVFRDMLNDITKELEEEEYNFFDQIPRRNESLDPQDIDILNYCHFITMKEDTVNALLKGLVYFNQNS